MAFNGRAGKTLTAQLRLSGGIEERVMAGNESFDGKSSNHQALDPGGSSRTITIDPVALKGAVFTIFNVGSAGENISISDGSTVQAVIQPGSYAIVGSSGRLGGPDGSLVRLGGSPGIFQSTEQTGTGSEQDIAHGLGVVPSVVLTSLTELVGSDDVAQGAHDATNVKITATSGTKYIVTAIAL